MLNIRTRIRTDLNLSKRIRSRIRSENIRTVFIPKARGVQSRDYVDRSEECVRPVRSHASLPTRKDGAILSPITFPARHNNRFPTPEHSTRTLLFWCVPSVPPKRLLDLLLAPNEDITIGFTFRSAPSTSVTRRGGHRRSTSALFSWQKIGFF